MSSLRLLGRNVRVLNLVRKVGEKDCECPREHGSVSVHRSEKSRPRNRSFHSGYRNCKSRKCDEVGIGLFDFGGLSSSPIRLQRDERIRD